MTNRGELATPSHKRYMADSIRETEGMVMELMPNIKADLRLALVLIIIRCTLTLS